MGSSLIVLGLSAVLASHWAHQILYHQLHVTDLQLPVAMFVAIMLVIGVGPLLFFGAPLRRLKRRGLLEYGALVGQHGWLVQQRWIRGAPVEEQGLLEAPELGPVADTITMYEAIERIKPAPLGKQSLMAVVVPALLPMVPVAALEVPVKDTLLKLLGVLL
jgi:hypothetical protein